MALTFFIREFSLSRGVLLWCAGIDFILLAAWRHLLWRYVRAYQEIRGVMLIGSEEECQHVYYRMQQQPQLAMELRSICTDLTGSDWESAAEQVDVLIICPDIRLKDKAKIVHYCNLHEKQALLIPNSYEVFCSGMTLDKIDDVPVFRPQRLSPTLEQRSLKRILDIMVALTGLLLALPLMILTGIAIKIFDPGPIFYSQERLGRYEKPFKVYKFRTMRVDAEKLSGPMLAQENDPRITRLGAFLRAVRLDELPQIWNVLVGDMSIVGPRPERPFFVEQFKQEIPEYVYRMNVKPGITGLAQVYGKYNTTAYDKLIYMKDGAIEKIFLKGELTTEDCKRYGLRAIRYDSLVCENPSVPKQAVTHIEDLSVSIGRQELIKNLSFDVHAGEITAVIGKNGRGKTTLGKALGGLLSCKGQIGYGKRRRQRFKTAD